MTRFSTLLTVALTLLAAAPDAHARRDGERAERRADRRADRRAGIYPEPKIKVLPFRAETRVSLRDRTTPGPVAALSVVPWQDERFLVETGVSIAAGSAMGFVGPFRTKGSLDFTAEPSIKLGPMLATGPVAGAGYRFYRQQGTGVHEHWTGLVGWRANAAVVRARTWGIELTARVTVDSMQTDLVLATSAVHRLSPVEGQFGLRFLFGHGRPK